MLKAISRRINQKDEGFTLIELMVVLVVIGILMAIAIPTFLGAKNKANDRSAQENVRNALTAEKEYYTDNQAYAAGTSVSSLEPAIGWAASAAAATGNSVFVTPSAQNSTVNDNILIEAQSPSGNCVYIDDEAVAPGAVSGHTLAAGTYYTTKATTCGTGDPAVPTSNTGITAGSGTAGTWGTKW